MEGRDLGIAVGLSLAGFAVLLFAIGVAIYYYLKWRSPNPNADERKSDNHNQNKRFQFISLDFLRTKLPTYKNMDFNSSTNSSQQTFVCGKRFSSDDQFGTKSSKSILIRNSVENEFASSLSAPVSLSAKNSRSSSCSNSGSPTTNNKNTIKLTQVNMNYTTSGIHNNISNSSNNVDNKLKSNLTNSDSIYIIPSNDIPTRKLSKETSKLQYETPTTPTNDCNPATTLATISTSPTTETLTTKITSTTSTTNSDQQPMKKTKDDQERRVTSIVTEDIWNSTLDKIFDSALSLHEMDRGTLRGARLSVYPE